jgi:L-aminopeptidase/D-esterase-like protein
LGVLAGGVALICSACASTDPRARDLGIPFDGAPGPLNAITDVPGVEVGHVSVTDGEARTGATAIFPLGRGAFEGVAAGFHAHNGTGEMTGAHLIEEIGAFFGPVILTGTLGVGTARDGVLEWTSRNFDNPYVRASRILPVVAETYDGGLSDAWSLPLRTAHVVEALDKAAGGPVEEGAVGGGTGMVCYHFKCGIGTASRFARYTEEIGFTVGVLVQANHGTRDLLTIAGVPVGKEIADLEPRRAGENQVLREGDGSIIVLIATDAPLLPGQLERLARRATIGMARTGAYGSSSSGDIFLAFSTSNAVALGSAAPLQFSSVPNEAMDPLFEAAAQANEEAIVNALVAGEDTGGRGGSFVHGLPHERVRALLSTYGRIQD